MHLLTFHDSFKPCCGVVRAWLWLAFVQMDNTATQCSGSGLGFTQAGAIIAVISGDKDPPTLSYQYLLSGYIHYSLN